MARLLVKNGQLWDGECFSCRDILLEGNTVLRMEPNISEKADFIYDASGKLVSAGLVDAHTHIRGISDDRYGTQAEMSCFPFGVTAAADAGSEQGNKALLDSFMVKNVAFVPVDIKNDRADLEKAERLLRRYEDKAVGLKVYFDTNASDVSTVAPLRQVCEYAQEKGLRVMVHCANSPTKMSQLLNTLGAGDILTHAFHGGANNAAEDNFESMRQAQARGVVIDAGFAGHVHTDFDVFKKALQQGVLPDVIGTDITKRSAYIRGGRYGMTMCINLACTLGMPLEAVMRAVTSNPAKALGKEKEWGCLKVGRCGDLAVFAYTDEGFSLTDKAGNHIESKTGYRCVLTVCDGQVLYRY